MYIASCPLRVSLFGGSTDNPYFVEKYGYGSVISFTCNLKTYITLHEDKIGYNMQAHKYIVNYSKREETEFIGDIQNELVRIVLDHFKVAPINVSMTSDAYSQGSGLASSSSYIISLIKCISIFNDFQMTDIEICKLAYQLELEMNPYCGYQDPYGCGIGGFKRIEFERGEIVKYDFLPTEFFKKYDAHLVFTGVTRNSKNVLKDVTDNIDKSLPLLKTVNDAYDALKREDYIEFLNLLNRSWQEKKDTSSIITENETIRNIDKVLNDNETVIAHKLCGAGNGGFFLTFSETGTLNIPYESVRIDIESNGVIGHKI
jgi:D-glycero-alpha-D-manno-heptose-7-phosphate kinase